MYHLNIEAVQLDKYSIWDTLISEDMNKSPITELVSLEMHTMCMCLGTIYRELKKKGFHVGFFFFFFFEVMKDGLKQMAAVKKYKETLALV